MNRRLIKYIIIVVLCFMLDSTIAYFLPYDFTKKGLIIVPHIGLMVWTLLNNTIEDDNRYFFASLVGIYYAIVYANSLPIYVLLYCAYAFFGRTYMKLSKFSLFEALAVVGLTIFVQEVVIYWLMWITNVTAISITRFLLERLVPTFIFNMIVLIPIFFIHNKLRVEGKNDVY